MRSEHKTRTVLEFENRSGARSEGEGGMGNKSWDDVLLEERESNSRLRQQQRDQAERERRLVERLAQLKEQQQALQQGKTVDAVGRDGKVKALEVGAGKGLTLAMLTIRAVVLDVVLGFPAAWCCVETR